MLSACSSTGTSSSNAPTGRTADVTGQAPSEGIPQRDRSFVSRTGEVYLMRGLADVFSRGMDVMASRMRAKGLDAVSYNHSEWQKYADEIIARNRRGQVSYPVVIMGHSLGGNESSRMASYLGARGVKVSLVVTFDPTIPGVVGKNVGTVINYYLPNERHDNVIRKGDGFTGSIENVNVTNMGVKHTTVEKDGTLQGRSISKVMALTKDLSKVRKPRSS